MNSESQLGLDAQSLKNLGNALARQGKLEEALQSYQTALSLNPDFAEAHNNLGNILAQQGKLEEALQSYQTALNLNPDFAEAHNNSGNILAQQDKLEEAIKSYQVALKVKPDFAEAHHNLGKAFKRQGNLEEALQSYQQALNADPNFDPARFSLCIDQLPIVYSSSSEIESRRNNYLQHLQNLAQFYQTCDPERQALAADAVGSSQPFFLAYQGLNDRDLQRTYGAIICQLMGSRYPQWSQEVPLPGLDSHDKIRIGFVSGFFFNHSNWKIPIQGWVQNLDRRQFQLFGYHTGSKRDRETAIAARAFDKFIQGPLPVEKWGEIIAGDELHVLIFPEFGMDPMAVKLGGLRLAPIQMTSWGHPETSGLPTIDYYLSSDLMEAENGQDFYTEKLVRLPNLSVYYTPLEIYPKAINRKEIGIDEGAVMFWCCQSLFKYLPQHDDVFPRIAQKLPSSQFVFLEAPSHRHITEVFRQRLSRIFEEFSLDYRDYCRFLPRLDIRTFTATAALADVFLDSIGWSGCNSSLESIVHNTPIVTWPGDSMRSRHSLAMLQMMGIEETVAASKEDYVSIAVRLGRDPHYRQQISRQMAENKHRLYGDLEPVGALEQFLRTAVQQKWERQTLGRAVADQRANRLADAEQGYRQILESHPDHPEALYGLGVLRQQCGQVQEAENLFRAVIQSQPQSVRSWFSLGNLRQAQGQLPEAEEAYRRAIALQPGSVAVYNNLGYALQGQGKWEEAIACYRKALELEPACVEAEVNLGSALHRQGKLSPEEQSRYAQLNAQLGIARQKAGDEEAAVTYFRESIALQPDLAGVHRHLGMALQARGEWEGAAASYQRSLALNPEDPGAWFSLGKIYQTQNQLAEAAVAFRQGLERLNPHYAAAIAARPAGEEQVPPTPARGEVAIGEQRFPAIPPVPDRGERRPFWSVVVTVHNRTQYLLECLASVLAQWTGLEEMEILVIDDASSSPLFELVSAIGGGVVRYYRNPHNLGLPGNWNAGIALSRGQWTHLLHDDDCIRPGFYAQLRQGLENCSESVGAAFTGYENINERGEVVFRQQVYGGYRGIAQDWLEQIGVANPLNMPAVAVRRETYERLGGYHPELTYTSDWEFYKRIAAFYDWWVEPEILARYRQHSASKTQEMFWSGTQATSIRRAIEISEGYLPGDRGGEITEKSRRHYFNYCLELAAIPLKRGKAKETLNLLREILKLDRSPPALEKLFSWLTQEQAAAVRDEIASRLIS